MTQQTFFYIIGYNISDPEKNTVYGLGRIGELGESFLNTIRLAPSQNMLFLLERSIVSVKSLESVYEENNIESTKVLKLDCEGT